MRMNIKFVSLYTENGFTMLEMIYSFSIFCMIIIFIPSVTQFIYKINPNDYSQQLEWEVFVQQTKKEIRLVDNFYVVNNVLALTDNEHLITYEKYFDKIRRRVDHSGHEVLLQNVKDVKFEQLESSVKITVHDLNDDCYEAIFYTYIDIEGVGNS